MKHEIEKALQSIPVPDLTNDIKAGIARAERNRITMTRSVKRISAIVASLVLCIGIVGTAAIIGMKNSNDDRILTGDDISLKFMGFDAESGVATAGAEYADKTGLKAVKLGNYTITDENGDEYVEAFSMYSYWADENGDLHFVHLPLGAYKIEADAIYDENNHEVKGHWELDFNFEDWPYGVFFDPRDSYMGSVEDGTAYAADANDISVRFVDVDEPVSLPIIDYDTEGNLIYEELTGDIVDKVLEITINSDSAPFKDIQSIGISSYIVFDENREYAGGAGSVSLDPLVVSGIGTNRFEWGMLYKSDGNDGLLYVINNGENQGRRCTVKIYSFIAEMPDGSRIEIQGDWEVDFTV